MGLQELPVEIFEELVAFYLFPIFDSEAILWLEPQQSTYKIFEAFTKMMASPLLVLLLFLRDSLES